MHKIKTSEKTGFFFLMVEMVWFLSQSCVEGIKSLNLYKLPTKDCCLQYVSAFLVKNALHVEKCTNQRQNKSRYRPKILQANARLQVRAWAV